MDKSGSEIKSIPNVLESQVYQIILSEGGGDERVNGENLSTGDSPDHNPKEAVNCSPKATLNRNAIGELLVDACIKGQLETVKDLLNQGADPSFKDTRGRIPLQAAIVGGYLTIVQCLVDEGADINMQGVNNDSPIRTARHVKEYEIIKYLLESGANVDAPSPWNDIPEGR